MNMRSNTNPGMHNFIGNIVDIAQKYQRWQDWLDLGTVVDHAGGLGLKPDRDLPTYAQGQWWHLRGLFLPDPIVATAGTEVGEHGEHQHDVPLPDRMRFFRHGDRVLIAWVNGQQQPVVVGIIERLNTV